MKVVCIVHGYVPTHNAGAEHMLHSINVGLVERGHEVWVHTGVGSSGVFNGTVDGVHVRTAQPNRKVQKECRGAGIIITHLDRSRLAISIGSRERIPVAQIIHNPRQIKHWRITPEEVALTVFNSTHLSEHHRSWRGPSIITRPPVDPEHYRTEEGRRAYITLINPTKPKGSTIFYEMARRMRDKRFLVVKGGYGRQDIQKLPNVSIWENRADVREVYEITKLLLMPSSVESWGRCAIEAAASGIPTVAHPTPGLRESLSYAGTFVDRNDPDAWERTIRGIVDGGKMKHLRLLARRRSLELAPKRDLDAFERAIVAVSRQARKGTVTVDALCAQEQYADHLAPVMKELPDDRRGVMIGPRKVVHVADRHGLPFIRYSDREEAGSIVAKRKSVVMVSATMDQNVAAPHAQTVFFEHGAGQAYAIPGGHSSYAGYPHHKNVGAFVMPGPYAANLMRSSYPNHPIVEAGPCKLDPWLSGRRRPMPRGARRRLVFSHHWDCKVCPETRSGLSYFFPLWRAFNHAVQKNPDSAWEIAGHAHPRIREEVRKRCEDAGIPFIESFDEVLDWADVYAVDNSSTLFEFAAVVGPVVVLNPPAYRKTKRHGLRFWEAAETIGPNLGRPVQEDLEKALDQAVKWPARLRKSAISLAYRYVDGTASAVAAKAAAGVAKAFIQPTEEDLMSNLPDDAVRMKALSTFRNKYHEGTVRMGEVFVTTPARLRQLYSDRIKAGKPPIAEPAPLETEKPEDADISKPKAAPVGKPGVKEKAPETSSETSKELPYEIDDSSRGWYKVIDRATGKQVGRSKRSREEAEAVAREAVAREAFA